MLEQGASKGHFQVEFATGTAVPKKESGKRNSATAARATSGEMPAGLARCRGHRQPHHEDQGHDSRSLECDPAKFAVMQTEAQAPENVSHNNRDLKHRGWIRKGYTLPGPDFRKAGNSKTIGANSSPAKHQPSKRDNAGSSYKQRARERGSSGATPWSRQQKGTGVHTSTVKTSRNNHCAGITLSATPTGKRR